mmetsp:Transcript_38948/g.37280  ORF Transcript_38948/g.37280 Transcript_38948/m.37280 type:complete len:115 (-) Transcript_38948:532-876(-)
MRTLFYLNYDITRLDIRDFISFSMDSVLLAMGRSLVNLHLQLLHLLIDFLAIAGLALFGRVNALADSTAFLARPSALGVHTGAHLHQNSPHSFALAACALLDSFCITSSYSIAG